MALNLNEFVHKKTLVMLGDQKFKLTELTLADMAVFRSRIQENRKATRAERAERMMKDAETIGGIEPTDILKMLDTPPTEEEYEAVAETIEGVIHLAYLSLQYSHPGISEDQVGTMITIHQVPEVVEAMMPSDDKKKSKTPPEKRSRGVLQSRSSSVSTKGRSPGQKSSG